MTRLAVNVDHVATLRQARGTSYPNPAETAWRAEQSGATGITVHLRADRRHIQVDDLVNLRRVVRGKLNLEMAATEEMVGIALEHKPHQVTLVPEKPDEVTTEGGLDLISQGDHAVAAARRLVAAGIAVSVFIDPDPEQISWLETSAAPALIEGFEINTDLWAKASVDHRDLELEKIERSASQGSAGGFKIYAGHALTTSNVHPVAAIPEIEELNIGHFLIGRAVEIGIGQAVTEMLAAMEGRLG